MHKSLLSSITFFQRALATYTNFFFTQTTYFFLMNSYLHHLPTVNRATVYPYNSVLHINESLTIPHLSQADIIQCCNMFTHWSAWTCCVDGRRLLRLQNRLEMMASTRDEFNSESGSNVFSPFSLKDSMMFQMSTRDTEIKEE